MEHVPWARALARQLLAEPLPRRWVHTQGVARKAETVAHLVGDEAESLICAAWLHDIGYAPGVTMTGFHPLDGARYLRDIEKAEDHICRLVAHHSHATVEAQTRGLEGELVNEFPAVNGLVTDALTYCDMTTSPSGGSVTVEARLNEISTRYGPNDVVSVSIRKAKPSIIRSVQMVTDRLSAGQG